MDVSEVATTTPGIEEEFSKGGDVCSGPPPGLRGLTAQWVYDWEGEEQTPLGSTGPARIGLAGDTFLTSPSHNPEGSTVSPPSDRGRHEMQDRKGSKREGGRGDV